jgi:peptide-methionine (S)-S-oxide reductase
MIYEHETEPEVIVLGAGCFWGIEDDLLLQPGVVATRVGFAGGHTVAPTYEDVCTGSTGHAEVVEVRFDPGRTTLAELLRYFWARHVATVRERGQYRSIIVCSTPEQLHVVEAVRAEIEAMRASREPIVTDVLVGEPFYEAGEEHQKYYEKSRERIGEVGRRCGLLE